MNASAHMARDRAALVIKRRFVAKEKVARPHRWQGPAALRRNRGL